MNGTLMYVDFWCLMTADWFLMTDADADADADAYADA